MKTARLILAILLIIPIGMLLDVLILRPALPNSNDPRELIYLTIGVPVLVVNLWTWFPEILTKRG